jgi:transcriptional regulator with XRE-family HTH domain
MWRGQVDEDEVRERFGSFLREARAATGLSQAVVAEKTGVSQSSLSMFEKGNYDPMNFSSAMSLSHFYGFPVETFAELLRGEAVTRGESLDALVNPLDEAQRTFVHTVVVTLLKGLR